MADRKQSACSRLGPLALTLLALFACNSFSTFTPRTRLAVTPTSARSTPKALGVSLTEGATRPITPMPLVTESLPATLPATSAPVSFPDGAYVTQSGDTLSALAVRFDTDAAAILSLNPGLPLTQTLTPGMRLALPPESVMTDGLATPLIPDSELVYSPSAAGFDVQAFVLSQPGFLAAYTEVLTSTEAPKAGWEIVELYAQRYSIHPRLLLALLEFQSHALSNPNPEDYTRDHALGASGPQLLPGLSHQLGWASIQLNKGYYEWRAGVTPGIRLADGSRHTLDSDLNAGTFAVVRLLGLLYKREGFARAASPEGFRAAYEQLFGDPFEYAIEPLIPGGLTQVEMQLPFEPGLAWAFTAGPHPVYGRTLPLGALDFGPPAEFPSCLPSPEWVVAVQDGLITYSAEGMIELNVGEGWSVVYLHVATVDRIPAGTHVRAGERLGHPSCEGGPATAAHLHIARKFRGEWIPADGFAPFTMSGWVAHFGPMTYTGTLTKGERVIESCPCSRAATRFWFDP